MGIQGTTERKGMSRIKTEHDLESSGKKKILDCRLVSLGSATEDGFRDTSALHAPHNEFPLQSIARMNKTTQAKYLVR